MSVNKISGPETGKRKRVTQKADGKLMFLVTHFSLLISGPLKKKSSGEEEPWTDGPARRQNQGQGHTRHILPPSEIDLGAVLG